MRMPNLKEIAIAEIKAAENEEERKRLKLKWWGVLYSSSSFEESAELIPVRVYCQHCGSAEPTEYGPTFYHLQLQAWVHKECQQLYAQSHFLD
jgi:hypothetical protein